MENTKDLELFIAQVDALGEAQRGSLLNGHVISIDASGVVVDLGLKRDGIIPSEDLGRLPSEEGAIKVGDEISVMVVDPVDSVGNLVVSISQARESGDWLKAKRMMDQDEIFEAAPQSFNRGGLIVPFGRLRGFVPASHISELPRGLDESERCFGGHHIQISRDNPWTLAARHLLRGKYIALMGAECAPICRSEVPKSRRLGKTFLAESCSIRFRELNFLGTFVL
ncbi:MAG: S1 RNA-binding domain-containing protein [Chloroflexi bacterium]|nr:S1 RNA-binding domain-containing protein [Chloroflexota bacterium]